MALMTAAQFVAKAKEIEKTTTAYMWGTYGRPITQALITAKKKQYPTRYTDAYVKALQALIGKGFAWDCCGLIKGILWGWDGKKDVPYSVNGVPDTGTDGFQKLGKNESTDWKNIPVGAILNKKGHMGIYIGDGLAIEATSAWQKKVMITYVSNIGVKAGYNGHAWESWYLLPQWIDYGDVPVPAPTPPKPVSKLDAWIAKNDLKLGAKGKHVEVIQAILMAQGYDVREIDGDYGAVTVNAVKKFQKDHKQVDDGWIGAQTWAVILGQREAEQPKPEQPAFKPYSVQVTTPRGLNVRKSASTSSAIVTTIGQGIVVEITKVEGDWGYTARYGGWVHLSYTKKI